MIIITVLLSVCTIIYFENNKEKVVTNLDKIITAAYNSFENYVKQNSIKE
jgi:hypothetical protein